jgi:hypothetical protein
MSGSAHAAAALSTHKNLAKVELDGRPNDVDWAELGCNLGVDVLELGWLKVMRHIHSSLGAEGVREVLERLKSREDAIDSVHFPSSFT